MIWSASVRFVHSAASFWWNKLKHELEFKIVRLKLKIQLRDLSFAACRLHCQPDFFNIYMGFNLTWLEYKLSSFFVNIKDLKVFTMAIWLIIIEKCLQKYIVWSDSDAIS